MKFESGVDFFVIFIILIKMIFLVSAVGHLVLTHFPESITKHINVSDAKLVYWKQRAEFIFIASMACLLIYHFRPGHLKPISKETSILFFFFGFILIITAKWNLFFAEADWYKQIVNALK